MFLKDIHAAMAERKFYMNIEFNDKNGVIDIEQRQLVNDSGSIHMTHEDALEEMKKFIQVAYKPYLCEVIIRPLSMHQQERKVKRT